MLSIDPDRYYVWSWVKCASLQVQQSNIACVGLKKAWLVVYMGSTYVCMVLILISFLYSYTLTDTHKWSILVHTTLSVNVLLFWTVSLRTN